MCQPFGIRGITLNYVLYSDIQYLFLDISMLVIINFRLWGYLLLMVCVTIISHSCLLPSLEVHDHTLERSVLWSLWIVCHRKFLHMTLSVGTWNDFFFGSARLVLKFRKAAITYKFYAHCCKSLFVYHFPLAFKSVIFIHILAIGYEIQV